MGFTSDNPKQFYEKVARELTQDEYDYLSCQINRTCISCEIACGEKEKRNCENWRNYALIGKLKVKSKTS